jgi:hypothetical protein
LWLWTRWASARLRFDLGAPPTPWAAIGTTRWWHLDRATAELRVLPGCLAERSAQTESVPSALVERWVSFPRVPAVGELRACATSLCESVLSCGSPARRELYLYNMVWCPPTTSWPLGRNTVEYDQVVASRPGGWTGRRLSAELGLRVTPGTARQPGCLAEPSAQSESVPSALTSSEIESGFWPVQ